MSTQKPPIRIALLNPSYFPRMTDFRLLFFADVVIILDAISVLHHVWHTTVKYDGDPKHNPVNVAMMPSVTLQVPFMSLRQQTFETILCQQNGWQSTHVHLLTQHYKGHSHNIGPVIEQIAHFPIRYSDGILRMWHLLTDYIDEIQRKKIIFLSDLQGNVRKVTNRADLTIALGKKFGATHILYPEHGWIYRRAKISKYFTVMRDESILPKYSASRGTNWSIIDAIAKLGQLGLTDYFTTIATKEGWHVI